MNQQRARRFRTALDADMARCIGLCISCDMLAKFLLRQRALRAGTEMPVWLMYQVFLQDANIYRARLLLIVIVSHLVCCFGPKEGIHDAHPRV